MLAIDLRTAYFSIGLTLLGITAGLILTQIASPRLLRGAPYLAASYLAGSLGWSTFVLAAYGQEPLRIVLSNTLIVISIGLLYRAMCELLHLKPGIWISVAAVAGMFVVSLVYGVWQPDYTLRVAWASVFLTLQGGQLAWVVLARPARQRLGSEIFTGGGFLVFTVFFFVRGILAFTNNLPDTNFYQTSLHTVLLVSLTTFCSLLLPFAFLLISNEQHFSHLQRLADTDALTGVLSRHALLDALQVQIEASRVAGWPLSICMLDIDNFKNINDRHGHLHGDEALKQIATTLRGLLRQSDLLGRFGGDEFLLLLPHTNPEQAGQLAERLRHHFETTLIQVSNRGDQSTLSLGLSALQAEDTPNSLLQRADEAMYQAKEQRNRVVLK